MTPTIFVFLCILTLFVLIVRDFVNSEISIKFMVSISLSLLTFAMLFVFGDGQEKSAGLLGFQLNSNMFLTLVCILNLSLVYGMFKYIARRDKMYKHLRIDFLVRSFADDFAKDKK